MRLLSFGNVEEPAEFLEMSVSVALEPNLSSTEGSRVRMICGR